MLYPLSYEGWVWTSQYATCRRASNHRRGAPVTASDRSPPIRLRVHRGRARRLPAPPAPARERPSLIRDALAAAIRTTLRTLEIEPMPEQIHLERPARREHGDWSSNVAMATAKAAGWNPRELAGRITEVLNADLPPHVRSVEIAGPGFVNFRLHDTWLHEVLAEVVAAGPEGYARPEIGNGETVQIEFVSANPPGRCMWATAGGAPTAMPWPG